MRYIMYRYLSAVVDEESNPRINAIAKVFGEALERRSLAWFYHGFSIEIACKSRVNP